MSDRYEQHVQHGVGVQGDHATATINNYYGTRPYVIEEFPTPTALDTGWLMAQPSRLLGARSQVVDFVGRDAELRHLRQWRDNDARRLSVLLLHAPGGQGKTRLAAEFATQSRQPGASAARRWRVLQAGLPGRAIESPGSEAELPADADAGTILVVDYADRWAHGELRSLLVDPILHQQRPARVLLIGRTVRWYAAIRAELAELQAEASDLLLPPLADDRATLFAAARDRFAQPDFYDLDASGIQPPKSMVHPDFGLALTLLMAALAAVDARSRGARAPSEPHELSAYLLDREYQAWQRLYDAGRGGQDYKTRPSVMARTVFAAVLTGAVSHRVGTDVLRKLELSRQPQDLLLDHRICYPPLDRGLVLEPLYPDRLAEDFIALFTPGHDISGYDPDPWTTEVPRTLLVGHNPIRPAIVRRAVPFLAATAARWPHVRKNVLEPLLRQGGPGLALDGGSSGLAAIAAIADIDPEILRILAYGIHANFSDDRNVDLDVGIADIIDRAMPIIVAETADDPDVRAYWYSLWSKRLNEAGRPERALIVDEEAVAYCRELAGGDSKHLESLATSLINLGGALRQLGRDQEAIKATSEAVGILRRLGKGHAVPSTLAMALVNLSHLTATRGRHEEALALAREAAGGYVEAVESSGIHEQRELSVLVVHTLATRLRELRRYEEALEMVEAEATVRREMAEENPAVYLPGLPVVLINFDAIANDLGQHDRALNAIEESVGISRSLARANPNAHLPLLAASLHNLGSTLYRLERLQEGLAALEEASGVYLQLGDAYATAHPHNIARFLDTLSAVRATVGLRADALASGEEAIGFYRQLVSSAPDLGLPGLANSLEHLCRLRAETGEHDQAAAACREAVDIYRQFAKTRPETYLPKLARALITLNYQLFELGLVEDAVQLVEESVGIYRSLAQAQPDTYQPDLTHSRNLLDRWKTELAKRKPPRTLDMPAAEPGEELPQGTFHVNLLARYDNGRLTIDPRIREGEVRAHMMAAMVVGGAITLHDLKEKSPEVYFEVIRLLTTNYDGQ